MLFVSFEKAKTKYDSEASNLDSSAATGGVTLTLGGITSVGDLLIITWNSWFFTF
jgi:hypothetical protein